MIPQNCSWIILWETIRLYYSFIDAFFVQILRGCSQSQKFKLTGKKGWLWCLYLFHILFYVCALCWRIFLNDLIKLSLRKSSYKYRKELCRRKFNASVVVIQLMVNKINAHREPHSLLSLVIVNLFVRTAIQQLEIRYQILSINACAMFFMYFFSINISKNWYYPMILYYYLYLKFVYLITKILFMLFQSCNRI